VKQTRHHALDLLRGLAAIGVAAYHFLADQGVENLESLGTFTVYLFFVLSGLTMMAVYGRQFSDAIAGSDLRTFYWHRISRIIPLLAAVSLASLVLAAPSLGFTKYLVASALYAFMTGTALFAFHMPGYLSNTTGAWSLGIEMMFYVVFPVMCLITARASVWWLAATAFILILAQQIVLALMHHWVKEDPIRFWHYYATFLMFLPFFVLGMLIARLRLQQKKLNLLIAFAFLAVIACFSFVSRVELFETHWAYLALTGMAFCAVLFAYASQTPGFLIGPSTFIGNASYALYLTHPFSVRLADIISDQLGYGPIVARVLFLPLALFIAHYTYVLFERPAQNYLRAERERRGFPVKENLRQSGALAGGREK
jgi:peptidoglycan/LPS O-acetylase OafA/YrhL